ncbi:Helix-turn-helix domain protein [compost metagenome]
MGVNLQTVRKLIQKGFLNSKEIYKSAKGSRILCGLKSVNKIIRTFNKRLECQHESTVSKRTLTFREAVNQFKVYGLTICDLVRAVFQRRLRPVGKINAIGLHQFLFSESVVRDVIKGDRLILREVVKELRSPQPSVRSWIKKGFLKAIQLQNRAFVVRRSDLDKFIMKYISLPEITNLHPAMNNKKAVRLWLKEHNIEPVSGQNDSGKDGLLYKRTQELLNLIGL